MKDAELRAKRKARRIKVMPTGVIYTLGESALRQAGMAEDLPIAELVAQGLLSGARAFYDPWLDARE